MNYNDWQGEDTPVNQPINQPANQQVTSDQPATNQQVTTTKNVKNERMGEESKGTPARQEFPTLETILKFAKSQPMIIQPDCAETYFNDMEACEWVDKHNRPIKKWQAALRAYASRWNQFSQSKSTPSHHTSTPVKYGI
jgi:hypothetical protein